MKHKNIDTLFQEKLKNLEVTPNARVWNDIAQKIAKKQKKIMPFWWIFGSVAAIFLIGFFLFLPIKNNDIIYKDNTIITSDTENKTIHKHSDSVKKIPEINHIKQIHKILIVDEYSGLEKKLNLKKTTPDKKVFTSNKDVDELSITLKNNNVIAKNSIDTNIVKNLIIKKDTVFKRKESLLAFKPKKELLLAVKEDKSNDKIIGKKPINKWTVSPVLAILNASSFTNTSPINVNLTNSTSGKQSFSYGIKVAYQIDKKWSIASGIHQQNTRFENANIIASKTTITNASSIVLNSNNTFHFYESGLMFDALGSNNRLNGSLLQEYGYIEVPLELKYKVLSRTKFKTDIVIGFSTLFLNNNQFELQIGDSSQFGFVNNLNSLNFSGNLGTDFNYLINKDWSVSVNPMLKAQLNTFNKNSNGFAPFTLGIYTGLQYKF